MKPSHRSILLAVLVITAVSTLAAQTVAPSEPFRLTIDCSRFRGSDENNSLLEVYYSFPQKGLTYKPDTAGYLAGVDLTLLVRAKDSLFFADRWLVPHVVRDTARLTTGMTLVGITNVFLSAGEYELKMIGRDRFNALRTDSIVLRVPIRLVGDKRPMISDIEFATTIRQGAKAGPFYKNTLEVIPNVTGLYSEEQKCYYYAEAYNLLSTDDRSDYTVRTTVYDAIGRETMSRERPKKRFAESSVIIDNFAVDKLRSGTYTLMVALVDSSGKSISATGKKFFVYNPTLGIDSTLSAAGSSIPLGIYMSMDEAELDREFRWCRYEVQSSEQGQYEQLKGVEAKRKFMSDFWRRRGPGAREQYLSRVEYANRGFVTMGREGYRTDRGRVFIMYGPPDDYDRHPNEAEMRPYEIWSFNNIQGGVIFVFVMRNPGGDYELVHSTHRNELHDEDWERYAVNR